jgi:hypothetical protein
MRLVNEELQRRIETTEATMQSLRLAVDKVNAAPC